MLSPIGFNSGSRPRSPIERVAGLMGWWNPMRAVEENVGQLVSLPDLTGNGRDFVPVAGSEPTVAIDAHQRRVISFDGAGAGQTMLFSGGIHLVGRTFIATGWRVANGDQSHMLACHTVHNVQMRLYGDPVGFFQVTGAPESLNHTPVQFNGQSIDTFRPFFIAVAIDTDEVRLQYNGITKVFAYTATTYPINQIGRFRSSDVSNYHGTVHEIAIYDRALSVDEITSLMGALSHTSFNSHFEVGDDFADIASAVAFPAFRAPKAPAVVTVPAGTFEEMSITPERYVHLIGAGRDVTILDGQQPNSTSTSDIGTLSPIDMKRPGRIQGLHIISENVRYSIHCEAAGAEFDNPVYEILDNFIWHKVNPSPNNTWISARNLGMGTAHGGQYLVARNILRISSGTQPVSCHDSAVYTKPCHFTLQGNTIIMDGTETSVAAFHLSSYGRGALDHRFVVKDNTDFLMMELSQDPIGVAETDPAKLYGIQNAWSGEIHQNWAIMPNNPSSSLRFRPEVLMITDATPDRGLITASGLIADKLLHSDYSAATSEFGGGGKAASIYGHYNVSEQNVGLGLTTNNHKLGKRLGDLSSNPQNLILDLDDGYDCVTISFDQDFRTQSNAAILSFINAALAGKATASLRNLHNKMYRFVRYPHAEITLTNASTVYFPAGAAVIEQGTEIRLATSSDVSIHGICLEDIVPGQSGRVLTFGLMRQEFLWWTGPQITQGATIVIDPTAPGRLMVGTGNAIGHGHGDRLLRFNV